jgi:hypothetical protein
MQTHTIKHRRFNTRMQSQIAHSNEWQLKREYPCRVRLVIVSSTRSARERELSLPLRHRLHLGMQKQCVHFYTEVLRLAD